MSSAFENIQDSYNLKLGDYRIPEQNYDDYFIRVNRTGVLDADLTKDLAILRKNLDSGKVRLDAAEQRLSDMHMTLSKQCLA